MIRTLRPMHPNPWDRLGSDWPEIPVRYATLGGPWGLTRWINGRPREIVLNCELTQVQRRVTIAHECEHLDRGMPCASLQASIEQRVLSATARYLIPDLEVLGRTVAVYDLHRAAEELWVTFPVVVDRLNGLSDEESLYVHNFYEETA